MRCIRCLFFFQAEDGIRDADVTGVQTCALPICFVELYATDNVGKTNYGTAGYLGHGYFVTVKHGVVALRGDDERQTSRRIVSIKIMYEGKEIPAKLVDAGDADVEVHSGDWAIIRTRDLDLPALRVDTSFAYAFA